MRSFLLIIVVMGLLPYIVVQPYIGVLTWSWLSYMNPHRLTWGIAYSFPFAASVGAATLIGMMYSKEPRHMPMTPVTIVLIMFILWASLTTLFAIFPDQAIPEWQRMIKVQVMTFVTLWLINDPGKLKALVWVITLSLGFYGFKGGVFTILTGGKYLVWGPEGSFIYGNNELALALLLTVPLLRFLQLNAKSKILRHLLVVGMLLTVVAVLGSQSRGAMLALGAMVFMLLLETRQKIFVFAAIAIAITVGLKMMPESWFGRMETIENYQQDRSAMGRLNVWKFAFELAKDKPLTGGGFNTFERKLYREYIPDLAADPNTYIAADAHSIYFEVLGEHGFVGLFLFLLLWYLSFRTCGKTKKMAVQLGEEARWAADLAAMLRVSLVTYAVGGAFLGLAYFDLYYHLIAMVVVVETLVLGIKKKQEEASAGQGDAEPVCAAGQAVVPPGQPDRN